MALLDLHNVVEILGHGYSFATEISGRLNEILPSNMTYNNFMISKKTYLYSKRDEIWFDASKGKEDQINPAVPLKKYVDKRHRDCSICLSFILYQFVLH